MQTTSNEKPQSASQSTNRTQPDLRGSGSDANSDSRRLENPENLQDKWVEDSFPASDPPPTSPITGIGATEDWTSSHPIASTPAPHGHESHHDHHQDVVQKIEEKARLPKDFKDNPAEQFRYGRRVEEATHHFDTTSKRLERGNPDVGDVDLGTIEADKPAEPDDNDAEFPGDI